MIDQRSHARFPVTFDVTLIFAEERYRGQTRDVSLGGMFVYTDAKLPFKAELLVELTLPALKEKSTFEVSLRWQQADGVGLAFKSLRAREVWALNQLFKKGA